jgi:PRTRC genetic system ThiF family protein
MKKIHYTDRYLLNPHHPVTVFVIGAGGTGSQVATNLARMSIALQALGHPGLHVTVFDPDTVTEANIGRQLFSESELGLNKAVALVTRINRFFGFSWEAKRQCYPSGTSDSVLANIIITCTDTTRSRTGLWRFLKKHRERSYDDEKSPIYWMDFGNAQTTGQVLIGNVKSKIRDRGRCLLRQAVPSERYRATPFPEYGMYGFGTCVRHRPLQPSYIPPCRAA